MRVWAVERNQDMTEGRGPMVLDKLYLNRDAAVDYMQRQRGVMGRGGFSDHAKTRALVLKNNPDYMPIHGWRGKCRGWLCTMCWPYGAEWQLKPMTVDESILEIGKDTNERG